jgi:hypothetical protein
MKSFLLNHFSLPEMSSEVAAKFQRKYLIE